MRGFLLEGEEAGFGQALEGRFIPFLFCSGVSFRLGFL
jgi:hypothetical protein